MSNAAAIPDTHEFAAAPAAELEPAHAFYTTPAAAWDAMYADCVKAEKSIRFEQYIIANDSVGLRFLVLFTEKAKAGVKVQLVLDSIGSHAIENSQALVDLRDAGGEILIFNHKNLLHIFFPHTWLPRNHAKTMIIDSRIAYVGSVCLAEEMSNWRDLHTRITGKIIAAIESDFNELWQSLQQAAPNHRPARVPPRDSGMNDGLRYVVHKPELRVNALYRELLTQIANAKEEVLLVTPYFLPPRRLRYALARAHKRGVRVTVLLSTETDVPIADKVGRSYFPRLLRLGIQLLLFKPSVMHAKYSIIDRKWATIGSTNLDYLSLLHNRETNLVVENSEMIERLHAQFVTDAQASAAGTVQSWTQKSALYKTMGICGRLFRQMM